MTIPNLTLPQYEINLPSDNQKITFRPYRVKEQKLFLMALEKGATDKDILAAVKQIIQACIIYPENFDIGKIPSFDLDYLFLNIRAKSSGEKSEREYQCSNLISKKVSEDVDGNPIYEEQPCNNKIKVEVNILDIPVIKQDGHSTKIDFGDGYGMIMKYPTLDLLSNEPEEFDATDLAMDTVAGCVDSIYNPTTVYKVDGVNVTTSDVKEFMENLSTENFQKVEQFFATMPAMKQSLVLVCDKCQYEHKIELEGLTSFFD